MGMLPGRAGPAAGPAMGGLPIEWEQQGDGLMMVGVFLLCEILTLVFSFEIFLL